MHYTKMDVSIKDFFSKYDQTERKLRIWSHLLKKSLMENFHLLCSDFYYVYTSIMEMFTMVK